MLQTVKAFVTNVVSWFPNLHVRAPRHVKHANLFLDQACRRDTHTHTHTHTIQCRTIKHQLCSFVRPPRDGGKNWKAAPLAEQ